NCWCGSTQQIGIECLSVFNQSIEVVEIISRGELRSGFYLQWISRLIQKEPNPKVKLFLFLINRELN
ncbi:hypothetical protein AB4369_14720, partial [Vibrio sp. 10N.261.49.A5]|uniref:hypothetical protein n=1 Tax=unclassified Vibrio TaxID=2614977 RepID=UPI00354BFBAF